MSARRRGAMAALVVVVTLLHGWVVEWALESRIGSGAADTRPRRIEVAFVRELAPTAPPPVAPAPPPPRPRAVRRAAPVAAPPAEAASAPEPAPLAKASEPEPPPEPPVEPAPEVVAELPPAVAASAPGPAASAAPAAPVFEWPPSTRMSYSLTGYYRGEVLGQARVEWLRTDSRYQVRLDVEVGPPGAALLARSSVSDGDLTDAGLAPRRYDEETRIAFRAPRRQTIVFDSDRVRLPNGTDLPRPAGVQDTASQFVQLTWIFTMQPQLLEVGRTVDIPLALPRSVQTWTYEVRERETLATRFGSIEALHVKPRREPRPGVELTAEIWIAPSLQYLPVRILIHQDAETWVDLLIRELPLQAAPYSSPPASKEPPR